MGCPSDPPKVTLCVTDHARQSWECVGTDDKEFSIPYDKIGLDFNWISIPSDEFRTLVEWIKNNCENSDDKLAGNSSSNGHGSLYLNVLRLLDVPNQIRSDAVK